MIGHSILSGVLASLRLSKALNFSHSVSASTSSDVAISRSTAPFKKLIRKTAYSIIFLLRPKFDVINCCSVCCCSSSVAAGATNPPLLYVNPVLINIPSCTSTAVTSSPKLTEELPSQTNKLQTVFFC